MTGFNALDSRVDTVDEIDPRIDLYLETLYLELTCRYGTQFLHLACATASWLGNSRYRLHVELKDQHSLPLIANACILPP